MNDLKYLKIFLWFMCYVILLFVTLMAKTVTGFLEAGVAAGIFNTMFYFLLSFLFPTFVVFLVFVVVKFIDDRKIHKLSLRRVRIR